MTIEAKISSEIPLPIPRWVISSPIHISSVVAAVSETTTMKSLPNVRLPSTLVPCRLPIVRKRKVKPIAWPAASATVR